MLKLFKVKRKLIETIDTAESWNDLNKIIRYWREDVEKQREKSKKRGIKYKNHYKTYFKESYKELRRMLKCTKG